MNKIFTPEQVQLATEIADTLNDRKSLRWHLQNTRKYSEAFLRETLAEVMAMDESEIISSRAAYFNHLVKHPEHGHTNTRA